MDKKVLEERYNNTKEARIGGDGVKTTTEPTETTSPSPEPTKPSDEPTKPSDDPVGLLGDVDLSGTIDVTDLTTLAISIVDKKPLTGQSFKNADVTKDGEVDLTDLATLRQFLSKKIENF